MSQDVEFLKDLFAPLGGVSFRRMFGGLGIYRDGVIFGATFGEGSLYLKADEQTRAAYEAEGCGPFVYEGNAGRPVQMPYWRIPERLYDDPEEFAAWARDAFGAALRAEAAKAAKPAKPAKAPRSGKAAQPADGAAATVPEEPAGSGKARAARPRRARADG
jgi:DNA transformation protein